MNTHTYALCIYGRGEETWKKTEKKSSERKELEPEPVEETITVIAHKNIQFMYTAATHTQRNFLQPNARNNSFSV